MLMPFFSLLVKDNIILSPVRVILLMVPFSLLHASGFTFNFVCDVSVDSADKNPITRGLVSKQIAILISLILLLTALSFFLLFYTSVAAIFVFILHILSWFSYSGLGIRFKETFAGVFIASFILWVAAPLAILVEFDYFSTTTLSLLFFVYLTYTGIEVFHTLLDYDNDLVQKCRTFAVRLGRKKTMIFIHMLLLAGYLCILINSVFSGVITLMILSILYGIGYFAIVAAQVSFYRKRHDLGFLWKIGRWPFLLGRLYLLVLSIVYLGFSPIVSTVIILAFLTYPYYTGKFA
jgi:4-hydroxybenzoate polyprenyltransferase